MSPADGTAALHRLGMHEVSPRLRPLTAAEFLMLDLPPRGLILDPWLPTQGLAMIHSARGVGKTHLALGIAYAVATGGRLLGWTAPEPRHVIYLDGEMPAATMQTRTAQSSPVAMATRLPTITCSSCRPTSPRAACPISAPPKDRPKSMLQ
jgi:AAA domain